ncbi:MAG: DUF1064 domain-containing protein [Gemmatimonadaceae bacterium]
MSRRQRSAFGKAQPYQRGLMNKGEAAYASVLDARKRAGHIADYKYESVTLTLGPNVTWRPDFLVVLPDGEVQLHEVKGKRKTNDGTSTWWAEDAGKVKIKVAREQYPFRIFVVWPENAKTLHFNSEEIAA